MDKLMKKIEYKEMILNELARQKEELYGKLAKHWKTLEQKDQELQALKDENESLKRTVVECKNKLKKEKDRIDWVKKSFNTYFKDLAKDKKSK